jgi:hypothetical protein
MEISPFAIGFRYKEASLLQESKPHAFRDRPACTRPSGHMPRARCACQSGRKSLEALYAYKPKVFGEGIHMAGSESWIAPELPALTLLKLRPVALGQFERWGIDPRKARNWKENLWRLLAESCIRKRAISRSPSTMPL